MIKMRRARSVRASEREEVYMRECVREREREREKATRSIAVVAVRWHQRVICRRWPNHCGGGGGGSLCVRSYLSKHVLIR
jgi:hypothetical protein